MRVRPRVMVLVDALGWEYVRDSKFLSDICPYRTGLRTVLGFSSGAIPSILTGMLPERNGHWNLFYYDPDHSPFRWIRRLRFLPKRVLDNRLTRKVIKETGRRLMHLGATFECYVPVSLLPFFNFSEGENIYRPGGLAKTPSIFDHLQARGIKFRAYSYHDLSDAEIFRRAEQDLQSGEYEFLFVYLAEMDAFLHAHCQQSQAVEEKRAWYETQLRKLHAAAKAVFPDVLFAVFSDHGMTPVSNHYDLVGEIERLGFRMPGDYLAVYDSTMARFWFFRPEARAAIADVLGRMPCGRILDKAELRSLGLDFPDQRYGELIFLMNAGTLIAGNNFNGQWLPAGMHGYHPDDRWSDAAFLSNECPRFAMNTITDIYRVMEEGVV